MNLEDAERLAISLIAKHKKLTKWSFSFDRAVRRFGRCDFTRKQITLSYRLTEANTEATVTHVILHEIAHALVGCKAKHGPKWRECATKLGANAEGSCCPNDVVRVDAPIKQSCSRCHRTVHRHRLPPHWASYACFDCYNKDGHLSPLEFTISGQTIPLPFA